MPIRVYCPKCNLHLKTDDKFAGQNVGCPKCRAIIRVPDRSTMPRSWLYFAVPVISILVGLGALAVSAFLWRDDLALLTAGFAVVLSFVGFLFFFAKKAGGFFANLSGLAISAASLVLAIGYPAIRTEIEKNQQLLSKNEKSEKQANQDLKDAQKKLDSADEASRKAAEFLKQAEEAPKKAEEFFKKAKEAQGKMEASEKMAAMHLAKSEEAEKATEILRAKAQEERKKTEEIEKEIRKVQRSVDETKKEIDETKKEVSDLQKKTEQDKTDIENRAKEVKSLLKKLEDALKGARLDLKSKQPQVRIKTANALAKLPAIPEARAILAEGLVEAMLDPLPQVRNAANEALAKIDPAIQPHVLTLIIGNDKRAAAKELEKLGKEARFALPALITCYRHASELAKLEGLAPDQYPIARAIWLDPLAKIAPDERRVVQIILQEVTNTADRFHFARQKAMSLLDTVDVNKKEKVKALLTVLNDRVLAVEAIYAIEKTGLPEPLKRSRP